MPIRGAKNGSGYRHYTDETAVPPSDVIDQRKADVLGLPRTHWREVLRRFPATGTRVNVATGEKVGDWVPGTGWFSEID